MTALLMPLRKSAGEKFNDDKKLVAVTTEERVEANALFAAFGLQFADELTFESDLPRLEALHTLAMKLDVDVRTRCAIVDRIQAIRERVAMAERDAETFQNQSAA